ncbi:MAG: GntR family transcriptional regulator [Candidatus Ratteibacteria bacterium]
MKNDFIKKVEEVVTEELLTGNLLTEQKLAKRLGVSRGPIREALSVLDEKGFLERKKKAGIKLRHLSLREAVEVYDARICVEGMAARLLVGKISQEILKELGEINKKYGLMRKHKSPDFAGIEMAGLKFHQHLVNSCGNRYLKQMADRFHMIPMGFRLTRLADTSRVNGNGILLRKQRHGHEDILKALNSDNPDQAEKTVRLHIQEAKEEYINEALGSSALSRIISE